MTNGGGGHSRYRKENFDALIFLKSRKNPFKSNLYKWEVASSFSHFC